MESAALFVPSTVHSPPGSPLPAHITLSQLSPSLASSVTPRPFTPDLKLISFTNPFFHVFLIPFGFLSRIFTCTELSGHGCLLVLVSCLYFFVSGYECKTKLTTLSFRVHIKLAYHIVSRISKRSPFFL